MALSAKEKRKKQKKALERKLAQTPQRVGSLAKKPYEPKPAKPGKKNRGYTKEHEESRTMVLDMTDAEPPVSENNPDEFKYLMTPEQIRRRMRRSKMISKAEWEILYKPIEEWDNEELARGRPRNKGGNFKGRKPQWVTREVHEAAAARFKEIVKSEMNVHTVAALDVINHILLNDDVDHKGKPLVAAGTKLDAAKFLIEHIVGKPKQEQNIDISVKLQGMLASAIVGPGHLDEASIQQKAMDDYNRAYGELPSAGNYQGTVHDIEDAEVLD